MKSGGAETTDPNQKKKYCVGRRETDEADSYAVDGDARFEEPRHSRSIEPMTKQRLKN